MNYYYKTTVKDSLENIKERITESLSKEGFGVLTEIDVRKTLKKKLEVDYDDYLILGACNPNFAYQALQLENKIGTMLPCNVIIRKSDTDHFEIAAINPAEAMSPVNNPELQKIAEEVRQKLIRAIDNI